MRPPNSVTIIPRRLRLALTLLIATFATHANAVNVTTYHNDLSRTGANTTETALTTSNVNVNGFGKLFSMTVDAEVYAQPLYVSGVDVGGQTVNVLYVVTMNNTLYAFNADTGATLWSDNFGPGISNADFGAIGVCGGTYPDLGPLIGITSTPYIDTSTNTLYCLSRTHQNNIWAQTLHAIDIASGAAKVAAVNVPTTIPTPEGNQTFSPSMENQRSAVTEANGVLYLCWGSHCDSTPYNGWIMAFNPSTLALIDGFCTTPGDPKAQGGIWGSGQGPAVDSSGNVYLMSGNGTFTANTGGTDFGNTFIKFTSANNFTVSDWFTPSNVSTLNSQDLDIGSTGVTLLPGTALVTGIGKGGMLYVVNTASMSHFNSGGDKIVQEFQVSSNHVMDSPVTWNNNLYIAAAGNPVKAFKLSGSTFGSTPSSQSPESTATGYSSGGSMSVSSNGTTTGSAILWVTEPVSGDPNNMAVAGLLRAFDATNLATELWNSNQNSTRDSIGNYAKFTPPTVANGKVYCPTFSNQIVVFGLLSTATAPSPPTNLTATAGNATVGLTWTGSTGATSYNIYRGTTPGGESTTPIATGQTSTAYTDTGLTNGTTYYYTVKAVNAVGTSTASNEAGATPSTVTVPGAPTGLTAVAGNATVGLTWNTSTGATSYNVYRGTTAGGESTTPVKTGLTSTSYTDSGLTNGTTYYYKVAAVDSVGTSALSGEASATPASGGSTTEVLEIACGNTAQPPYVADTDFSGGTVSGGTTHAITTSAVTNPAPVSVYQHARYGNLTYTITGLTAGASYGVRLHFCEYVHTATGQRQFNVSINGTQVLTNFDIFATAGAEFKANAQSFTATANASGQIAITFTTLIDNAIIGGIEITTTSSTNPTPPAAPTNLTATSGNATATLNWTGSTGASTYNVYRGTTSGGESTTPIATALTSTTYANNGLTNGTTYYYKVAAVNTAGTSALSTEASATPTGTTTTTIDQIDCGSPTAVAPFAADEFFSAGTEFSSAATINLNGQTNPAPTAVYQTVRWNSSFNYTIPNLTAGSTYTVRLHFCELSWTAAGKRVFNVAVNGTSYLSNFDVFATAGGENKALIEQTTATANASGQIVISFTQSTADNPEIAGIEISQ